MQKLHNKKILETGRLSWYYRRIYCPLVAIFLTAEPLLKEMYKKIKPWSFKQILSIRGIIRYKQVYPSI